MARNAIGLRATGQGRQPETAEEESFGSDSTRPSLHRKLFCFLGPRLQPGAARHAQPLAKWRNYGLTRGHAVVQVDLGLDFQCSWAGLFKNWRYLPLLSVTYRYEALFSERA